jgi:hypothetical protein
MNTLVSSTIESFRLLSENIDVKSHPSWKKSGIILFVGYIIGVLLVIALATLLAVTDDQTSSFVLPQDSPQVVNNNDNPVSLEIEALKIPLTLTEMPLSSSSSRVTCRHLKFRDLFPSDSKRVSQTGGNLNLQRMINSIQDKSGLETVYEIMGCMVGTAHPPANYDISLPKALSLLDFFKNKPYVKLLMTLSNKTVMWFVCMRQIAMTGAGDGSWVCMLNPESSSLSLRERLTLSNPHGYFSCYDFHNPFSLVKQRACFDSMIAAEATMSAVKTI